MSHRASHRRGFTLIEMLIVISVIAILTLIVLPRFMGAIRKTRESTLCANLRRIRLAVANFQADTGVFPAVLGDLVQPDATTVTAAIPDNSYRGPYLEPSGGINGTGIPKNPITNPGETDVTVHWKYSASDGGVTVPDTQAERTTLEDGTPYGQL